MFASSVLRLAEVQRELKIVAVGFGQCVLRIELVVDEVLLAFH